MGNSIKHFLSLKDITPKLMKEIFELTTDVKKNSSKYSKIAFGKKRLG